MEPSSVVLDGERGGVSKSILVVAIRTSNPSSRSSRRLDFEIDLCWWLAVVSSFFSLLCLGFVAGFEIIVDAINLLDSDPVQTNHVYMPKDRSFRDDKYL